MSFENKNIEEMFRSSFEDWKTDVPADAWTNVENGLNHVGNTTPQDPNGLNGSSFFSSAAGKVALWVSSVLVVGTVSSVLLYNSDFNETSLTSKVEKVEDAVSLNNSEIKTGFSSDQKENKDHNEEKVFVESISSEKREKRNVSNNQNRNKVKSETETNELTSDVVQEYQYESYKPRYNKHNFLNSAIGTPNDEAIENAAIRAKEGSDEEIIIKKPFSAKIYASKTHGKAPLTVSFTNHGFAEEIVWDFNDGGQSENNITEYIFENPGEYEVSLTVYNEVGEAVGQDLVTILVDADSKLDKPVNVFSPNNDGVNDYFFVSGTHLKTVKVSIYNQGGSLVYSWEGLEGKWDGRDMSGRNLEEGVYYYLISAVGVNDGVFDERGTLTIVK